MSSSLRGELFSVVDFLLGFLGDFCFTFWLPVSPLHKLVLQRQAMVDPDPSSVMSLWWQDGAGSRGLDNEPKSTSVLKHSRMVAEIRNSEIVNLNQM